jgi:hypothetical protein
MPASLQVTGGRAAGDLDWPVEIFRNTKVLRSKKARGTTNEDGWFGMACFSTLHGNSPGSGEPKGDWQDPQIAHISLSHQQQLKFLPA